MKMTNADVITIQAHMCEASKEKLRDILRAQQSTPLKFITINEISIYYHYLEIRSNAVLFKLRLKHSDDYSIPCTVAMVFYASIHSVDIDGRRFIYE